MVADRTDFADFTEIPTYNLIIIIIIIIIIITIIIHYIYIDMLKFPRNARNLFFPPSLGKTFIRLSSSTGSIPQTFFQIMVERADCADFAEIFIFVPFLFLFLFCFSFFSFFPLAPLSLFVSSLVSLVIFCIKFPPNRTVLLF